MEKISNSVKLVLGERERDRAIEMDEERAAESEKASEQ